MTKYGGKKERTREINGARKDQLLRPLGYL